MTVQNQTQLQRELDRQAWKGGYVEVDPDACPILIDRQVTMRDVTIIGQHRTPQVYVNVPTFEIAAGLQKSPFSFRGAGGGFVGCSFKHLGQTNPQAVKPYPPTILVEEHEHSNLITVRDCTFVNSYHMIDVRNGRFNLEHIYGQVLDVGISIENSRDTGRMSNLHFWPFWSLAAIRYWPDSNSRAIVLHRADWTQMENIFIYGVHVGIQTGGDADASADFSIANLGIDACYVGLDLYQTGSGGIQINNMRVAGNRSHGGPAAIPIHSATTAVIRGAVQIANLHLHGDIQTESIWPHDRARLQIVNSYRR